MKEKNSGFGTIELIEIGFRQKMIDNEDYYLEHKVEGLTFITRETYKELKKGELFTLIMLADYEQARINNTRGLCSPIRIFGTR